MSRCLRVCALAVALAATSTSAQEQSDGAWEVELSVPLAALTGHTTYRIQAADQTVESELEFPLGGFVAGGRGQLASQRDQNRRRVVFEATALHSFTGSEGTLKDSDWFSDSIDISTVGAAHPGKDIYSESKARLSALVLEGRAAWELEASPGLSIAPLVGVLYQRFGYEVRDVVQVGYGPYAYVPEFTGSASGSVLDYEVRYRALYAGARGALVLGSGTLAAEAWYSPFAHAEDRDDHLLRSKLSASDADGSAWQAGVSGRLALGPSDALQAQLSLVRFTTAGTQLQLFYAGPFAGRSEMIDTTITSSRTTVVLVYSHRI